MFYLAHRYNQNEFGILDTSDNIVERYTKDAIKNMVLSGGLDIVGVEKDGLTQVRYKVIKPANYEMIVYHYLLNIAKGVTSDYMNNHLTIRVYYSEYEEGWFASCYGLGKVNSSGVIAKPLDLIKLFGMERTKSEGVEVLAFDLECSMQCAIIKKLVFNDVAQDVSCFTRLSDKVREMNRIPMFD